MRLINSANMDGLDPLNYMTDVLTRLPTHPNSRIGELFPHNGQPLQFFYLSKKANLLKKPLLIC
jgi:hypothetical protein